MLWYYDIFKNILYLSIFNEQWFFSEFFDEYKDQKKSLYWKYQSFVTLWDQSYWDQTFAC